MCPRGLVHTGRVRAGYSSVQFVPERRIPCPWTSGSVKSRSSYTRPRAPTIAASTRMRMSPTTRPRFSEGITHRLRSARRSRTSEDGLRELAGTLAAVEGGVTEVEDAPVGGEQVIAVPALGHGGADDRQVQLHRPGAALVGGVPEVEDAAVGGEEPVSLAAGCRRHRHDRLVQRGTAHAAQVAGVAIGEDAPV